MKSIYYLYVVMTFILGSLLLQGCAVSRDGLYLKYLKEKDSVSYYQFKYNEAGARYFGSVFIEIDNSLLNERDFKKNLRYFRHNPTSKKGRKPGGEIACAVILTDSRNRSVFNIGKPLTADTVNFVNMRQNISQYYKNASDFKLVSYVQVDTLTSKKDIKKYVKHDAYDEKHITWLQSFNQETGKYEILLAMNQENRKDKLKQYYQDVLWRTLDDWRTRDIQKGDGIWKLSFHFEQKPYEGYIFINPSTHKVTYAGDFMPLEFDREIFQDVKTTN